MRDDAAGRNCLCAADRRLRGMVARRAGAALPVHFRQHQFRAGHRTVRSTAGSAAASRVPAVRRAVENPPPFHARRAQCVLLAGLAGSLAAVALVWQWAAAMFGEPAGVLAALLLAVHPVFWCAGVLNPVRTFLALVAAVAIAAWRGRFYTASLCLGLLSGFRPEVVAAVAAVLGAGGLAARGCIRDLDDGRRPAVRRDSDVADSSGREHGGPAAISRGFFDYLRANSRD